jgi:hypothetical protein
MIYYNIKWETTKGVIIMDRNAEKMSRVGEVEDFSVEAAPTRQLSNERLFKASNLLKVKIVNLMNFRK